LGGLLMPPVIRRVGEWKIDGLAWAPCLAASVIISLGPRPCKACPYGSSGVSHGVSRTVFSGSVCAGQQKRPAANL